LALGKDSVHGKKCSTEKEKCQVGREFYHHERQEGEEGNFTTTNLTRGRGPVCPTNEDQEGNSELRYEVLP
jgi:hypothetical protein